MIYGQCQYYHDELNRWSSIITFHKEALRESVWQINILLGQQNTSAINERDSRDLTALFGRREQQFDRITNQIISQQQRLQRSVIDLGRPVELPVSRQQDSLRLKMKNAEWKFIHAKYTCSVFLSSFVSSRSLPFHNYD